MAGRQHYPLGFSGKATTFLSYCARCLPRDRIRDSRETTLTSAHRGGSQAHCQPIQLTLSSPLLQGQTFTQAIGSGAEWMSSCGYYSPLAAHAPSSA